MEPQPPLPAPSANQQIARAAGTVMVAIILSQVIGLAAKMLTAQAFGTGMQSEAFFAANRFAEILFNLVAGGALGSAFIPTISTVLARGERPQAWRLASAIANLITLVLTALSALAMLFAPWLVTHILAPGFSDPFQQELTVTLLRIQLPSSLIFGLSGLVMGILNAHQSFLFPALAPSMYSIGWILGITALAPSMGIHGLAWGVVLGSLMHLGLQIPVLLRQQGRHYSPTLGLEMPEVREVARLMGPRLLGVAVVQLNFLINTNLASSQSSGSLTGISLAFPLMLMPQAAIAQAAAIAALPTFSRQAALGKLDEMRHSLSATLRGVLLLAIPASVGLMLLREPLVTLLYQRNAFTEASTTLVAWALLWYAAGLVGHSVVEVVSRAFYALHDTKTPVFVGIGAMSLNIFFSLFFSWLFTQVGWMPHGGLALANSLATALEMVVLLVLMRKRLRGLEGVFLGKVIWQGGLPTAAMAAALVLWLSVGSSLPAWQVVTGGVFFGGAIYGGLVALLRVPEVETIWNVIRRRINK